MANLKQQITPPRLTARLTVRLTPSELSRVRARAKKLRLTPSELVRRRLSGGKLIVKYYQTVDPAVIAQIKAIGNNLNQIAKVCNARRSAPPARLNTVLKDIEDFVLKAVDACLPQ